MDMIGFAAVKAGVEKGIKAPVWDETTGADVSALRRGCEQICREAAGEASMTVKARLFAYLMENARLAVNTDDIFADRLDHGGLLVEFRHGWLREAKENVLAQRLDAERDAQMAGAWDAIADFSHTSPDWDRLLELGIGGVLEETKAAMRRHEENGTLTEKMAVFYRGCICCWEAVLLLLERMERHFAAQEQTPAVVLAAQLTKALREHAPETFVEGLKLFSLFYLLQNDIEGTLVRSLGCIDVHLLRLYRADIEQGRYTPEQIDEALRVFYWRINAMNHPNNLPICFGAEGVNELTERMRRVYDEMDLYCPKIQVRMTKDTPDEFLEKVLCSIRRGNSSYVFANDEVVVPGLMQLGMAREHAQKYVPVGCYEHMAMGSELPLTCAGKVNLAKMVELALNNGFDRQLGLQIGPQTGIAEDMHSAADFERAYYAQLEWAIKGTLEAVSAYDEVLAPVNPSPLFSATMESCIAKGADAYDGGMIYNNASINCVALASAVDALLALRQLVDGEKRLTVAQLRDILNENWQGQEALRRHVLRHCEKYGNGSAQADVCAAEITDFCAQRINNAPNGRGGVFRMGLFSINWIFELGERTAATPDGRLAGEPVSKNLCATTGMDKCGPTALVRTATAPDMSRAVNGAVLDMLIHPTAVQGEAGIKALKALLRTFCERGGQCVQFNVLDAQQLRRAKAEPEKYASLQVRVCGWNAYFVDLSAQEQDMFIAQAEGAVQ